MNNCSLEVYDYFSMALAKDKRIIINDEIKMLPFEIVSRLML
jgi:hypothetical protein